MRDFGHTFVGLTVVFLLVGIAVGRVMERSRRAKRDYAAAKVALQTAKDNASAANWKALGLVALVGFVMLALFLGLFKAAS